MCKRTQLIPTPNNVGSCYVRVGSGVQTDVTTPGGGGILPYKGFMGTCGHPGYVFRDFCLKQGQGMRGRAASPHLGIFRVPPPGITTPKNVGTCSSSWEGYNPKTLQIPRKLCVACVPGPYNVERAMQKDPTLFRKAFTITKQKKCWELLAQKFVRFQTLLNNSQNTKKHATINMQQGVR